MRWLLLWLGLISLPAAGTQDWFLESALEPGEVYVQAQTVYTLRFYHSIDVRDIAFSGPTPTLADIQPLEANPAREETRQGRRYRVHERRYLIQPFASGAPQALTGAVAFTSLMGRRQQMSAPSRTLTVLPALEGNASFWLPASQVTLTEHWQPNLGQLRPGERVERRLRIEARGVRGSQIPALTPTAPGFEVHALPPRLETRLEQDLLVGVREQTFLVIARENRGAGFPELSLPWWDTQTRTARVARLPSRDLHVMPEKQPAQGTVRFSPWLAWAALPGLILALAGHWWRANRLRLALMAACGRHDARGARDVLLAWGHRDWPGQPPLSLGDLLVRLNHPGLRQAVQDLERQLYGPKSGSWQGQGLRDAVRAGWWKRWPGGRLDPS